MPSGRTLFTVSLASSLTPYKSDSLLSLTEDNLIIYGGRRLMEGHQIVALRIRVRFSSITPHGQVCIVAIAADCKSVTLIHRRFDSYLAHQQGAPAGFSR